MQFQELARQADVTHSTILSVRKMTGNDYYELREKGGVLGRINVRVFFGVDPDSRSLVILGAIKKENEGPTPQGDIITMRRRWRKYLAGDYSHPSED